MPKDAAQDLKINTLEVNFKTMFDQNNKDHKDLKNSIDTLSIKWKRSSPLNGLNGL